MTTKLDELRAELKWAWDNLRYEIPYPEDDAEYKQCAVCGNRDFDHKTNCAALVHKQRAKELTKGTK